MPIAQATVERALTRWHLDATDVSLVAQRENVVFNVLAATRERYALRFHRPGYQTVRMVNSELSWVQHLKSQGLNVPKPVASGAGSLLHEIDGYYVDVLTWLPGTPMGKTGNPLELEDRTGTFFKVGRLMAQVHRISDEWQAPDDFERTAWDIDGLLGDSPHWNRFWDNPGLDRDERSCLIAARNKLREQLADASLDYGLIHADMLRENVMVDGAEIGLIDFDDSGFGFRLFDVATALFKNRSEPDYKDLQRAFLDGYRAARAIDTKLLSQMMLVRALSYLGWIIPRMKEADAHVRQKRFLRTALPMVHRYLEQDATP